VSRVLRPTEHIVVHFGDEQSLALVLTTQNKQEEIHQNTMKHNNQAMGKKITQKHRKLLTKPGSSSP